MPPRSRSTTERRTSDRRIHFFRADTGADESGRPYPLRLDDTLRSIDALPLGEETARYWERQDGERLCMWVDRIESMPQRLRLGRTRSNALPQSERAGQLRPLRLRADAGISEQIHICIFEQNIVGVEFNFYGPRPTLLPGYIAHVTHAEPGFRMEALLRHDVLDQLSRYRELRWLELQVRPAYVQAVREADESLGEALSVAEAGSGAGVVGVFLRPEPYGRTALTSRIFDFVRRMAGRDDLRDNAWQFKIKGVNEETGRADELDILQDQLLTTKKIVREDERSRALDNESAFAAIEEAYEELRPLLEQAASVALDRRVDG